MGRVEKALAGDEKYRKFFYLRKAKPDGSLPNNWQSKFGGPAWAKFGDTDYYYLHLYDPTQADLDWHNPEVRQELFKVINFWRSKSLSFATLVLQSSTVIFMIESLLFCHFHILVGIFHYRTWLVYSNYGLPQNALGLREKAS